METDLPVVRLGDVCELIPARSLKSKGAVEVTAITTACLTETGFDAAGLKAARMDPDDVAQARVEAGEVLIARSNTAELVGRAALYRGIPAGVVASDLVIRVRPSESVEPTYLNAYLSMLYTTGYWRERAGGASGSMKKITRAQLRAAQLPLPPLDEQHRIASLLDEQLSAVEDARTAAENQLEAIGALPAAYLRAAFDSPAAQGWPRVPLGSRLTLRKEIERPVNDSTGIETFVGLQHVESGTGARLGSEEIDLATLSGRKPRFYRGDIVYGYLRPYLNKVWVAEFDGLCSVDQYVYTYDPAEIDPYFVSAFMRSPVFLRRAPVNESPGQLPRIRTREVAAVEIGLPPLPVQREVAAQLRHQQREVDAARAALSAQLDSINALPAALLREAFAGRP